MPRNFSFDDNDIDSISMALAYSARTSAEHAIQAGLKKDTFQETFNSANCANFLNILSRISSDFLIRQVIFITSLQGYNDALHKEMKKLVTKLEISPEFTSQATLTEITQVVTFANPNRGKSHSKFKSQPVLPEETRPRSVNHPHNAEWS